MLKIHTFDSNALPLRVEIILAGVRCKLATNSQEILSCVSHWIPEASNQHDNFIDLEILADRSISRELPLRAHFRGLKHLVFAAFVLWAIASKARCLDFGRLMPDAPPMAFTDAQLTAVLNAARPLQPGRA